MIIDREKYSTIFEFIDSDIDNRSGISNRVLKKKDFYHIYITTYCPFNILRCIAHFSPPNRIWVHRKYCNSPDISYLDEIISLLHEYGHFLSLHYSENSNNYISEKDYDYNLIAGLIQKDQPKQTFLEEINAWKYAFLTIRSLPILLTDKFHIGLELVMTASEALICYFDELKILNVYWRK